MISVSPKSLGVKTAATPSSLSLAASADGTMPPTTTGTSSTRAASASAAAQIDAASRRSRRRTARPRPPQPPRSAPGSTGCPGRPPRSWRRGHGPPPARRRWSGRRDPACRPGAQPGAELLTGTTDVLPHPGEVGPGVGHAHGSGYVGARSPRTPRAAPARHSPVVAPARAATRVASMRFAPDFAASASPASDASTSALSRSARHASRPRRDRSASGSAAWIAASTLAASTRSTAEVNFHSKHSGGSFPGMVGFTVCGKNLLFVILSEAKNLSSI